VKLFRGNAVEEQIEESNPSSQKFLQNLGAGMQLEATCKKLKNETSEFDLKLGEDSMILSKLFWRG